jgi:hypothetical protein
MYMQGSMGAQRPGVRTSPTQVFSSWLYGFHTRAGPSRTVSGAQAGSAYSQQQVQQAMPLPLQQQQLQMQQQASCIPGDAGAPQPGPWSSLWQWVVKAAAGLLSDGSGGVEAGLCHVLFVAAFATNPSAISLVYLASMLLVPLLAQQPVKLYWTAMLVYTEVGVVGPVLSCKVPSAL